MFDFIPIESYTPIFYYTVLVLVLFTSTQCFSGSALTLQTARMNRSIGWVLVIFLVLYMGLRPVHQTFGDTINYAAGFEDWAASGEDFKWDFTDKEWLFYNLMHLFAKYSDIHAFFLLCSTIYVGCLWLAMQRMFKEYVFIPFLVILSTFTFWSYGVNGIRNGMSAAVFILAITYIQKLPIAGILCVLAVGLHSSAWLMIAAAVGAWFYKDSFHYLWIWFACVLISLFSGFWIQNYLATWGIFGSDERFANYLTGSALQSEIVQVSMTFRWDFLLYSVLGVWIGRYFIFKEKFEDEYYQWIYNTFLLTNSVWVLIIRAAYSNRFAQISWFIMPIVLIYPFMKRRFWEDHERKLGYALLALYAFAFYMNIIKGNEV